MPIYEYLCRDCNDFFEVMQKMSDRPLRKCKKCSSGYSKTSGKSSGKSGSGNSNSKSGSKSKKDTKSDSGSDSGSDTKGQLTSATA